jgi:hypothetical protein
VSNEAIIGWRRPLHQGANDRYIKACVPALSKRAFLIGELTQQTQLDNICEYSGDPRGDGGAGGRFNFGFCRNNLAMDVQWPLPIGIYEKIHAGPREVYWLGPLPFSSRAGILVPDYGPRPFPHSAIQPGVITVPLSASKLIRNNPFATSLSHRVVPHPLKFVEQQSISHSSEHVFPSDALRSLYRLAERIYSNPLGKHTRPVDALRDSQARAQPAASPSRDGSVHAPPSLAIFDRRVSVPYSSDNSRTNCDLPLVSQCFLQHQCTLSGRLDWIPIHNERKHPGRG